MHKLVNFSRTLFYSCGALLFVAAIYYVLSPLRSATLESKATIRDSGDVARGVREQIAPTAKSVGIILKGATVASDEMAKSSIEQKKYWKQISVHTNDAIGDAQDAIKEWGALGFATRAQIMPIGTRLQTTLERTSALLLTTNNQVEKVGPLVASATRFTDDADQALTNPELAASLVNFRRISGAWAGMSEDAQKKLHATFYPVKPSRFGMVMDGIRLAGPVGEILYNFSNIRR